MVVWGDTIAAIATAPGRGGVAVVRVSGSESFGIAEKLTGEVFVKVEAAPSPLVRIRKIRFPSSGEGAASTLSGAASTLSGAASTLSGAASTLLDEGVILFFKSPHSYTGEDVVEFQCHGGAVTPRRVLEACLAAGARMARRGEFTERAFLNGKLDYDQAESVLDLVDAKTARAADAALEGLSGRKRRELTALYQSALDLSTKLEHALDVDESDLAFGFVDELRIKSEELRVEIASALRRANEGKILRNGALVVLAGPPNSGKSSLMNALLEENRAIVSDIPGTTRDSIEEWLDLDGWPIRLVDTAGLRESQDEVEVEGVRRAEDLIAKADLVLWLRSCEVGEPLNRLTAQPLNRSTAQPLNRLTAQPLNRLTAQPLNLSTKCDLGRGPGLNVSAKTGEGLDELKRTIVAKLEERANAVGEAEAGDADVAALREALTLLEAAGGGLETEDGRREEDPVLLANAVRSAAERLGAAVGAIYSSDLLDNLFSRFCVGK